jgi:Zn ribbon nucleic-acid-binding protein
MAKVIERLEAHYEVQDLEMGKVYMWRPESIVVECEECGKKPTLTVSKDTCGECGADHRAIVEEVLETRPKEEQEVDHPWRSLRPYYTPASGA